MKFTYVISQKIKIALSLTIMIVMLLMTNFLSKRHFSKLQGSFTSVYEDRLLVEIHIYKITTFLNEKDILLHEYFENRGRLEHTRFSSLNDSIEAHIMAYEKTVFTAEEAEVFKKFKRNLTQLSAQEHAILSQEISTENYDLLLNANKYHAMLSSNLSQLSNIQREEGQRLLNQSKQLMASNKVTLQFELVILIVIGLIVQALIFSSKSARPKIKQKWKLN